MATRTPRCSSDDATGSPSATTPIGSEASGCACGCLRFTKSLFGNLGDVRPGRPVGAVRVTFGAAGRLRYMQHDTPMTIALPHEVRPLLEAPNYVHLSTLR